MLSSYDIILNINSEFNMRWDWLPICFNDCSDKNNNRKSL